MRPLVLTVLLLAAIGLAVRSLPAGPGRPAQSGAQEQPEKERGLAIIVNRSNPVQDLSFTDLRKIFLGERGHWSNGRRITVVMLDSGRPERQVVIKNVYQMKERDFNRYFLQATFVGEVFSAPKTLATPTGARKFVFNLPGAIGYVPVDDVDDSVKVVRVDGRLPGDKGYQLNFETR